MSKEENLVVALNKEYYKMHVGLAFSKAGIAALERALANQARLFLQNFQEPYLLYLYSVGSITSEQTYKLYLELTKLRQTKIKNNAFKFKGQPVTWQTWRQWAITAPDSQRKAVFDDFISKSRFLAPVVKAWFAKCSEIFANYGVNPLHAYLYEHRTTLSALKNTIEEMNSFAKKPFLKQFRAFALKLFDREPRYYDDFYYMRNIVFNDLPHPKLDPIALVLRTLHKLGISTKHIKLDAVDRPKKYASPFCSFIKIPTDVRVSYKRENPINDLATMYHEYGHAAHASTISAQLPYWKKYLTSMGLAETFSTLFEDLIHDPVFLVEEIKLKPEIASLLVERIKFVRLYATTFYCANSLFRIETWEKQVPFEQWDGRYAFWIKKCMGVKLSGAYWKLHHILPENLMYVPSYLLAMTRSAEIHDRLRTLFGRRWWNNPKAGGYIKALMAPGTDSEAGNFSKPNVKAFAKTL